MKVHLVRLMFVRLMCEKLLSELNKVLLKFGKVLIQLCLAFLFELKSDRIMVIFQTYLCLIELEQ